RMAPCGVAAGTTIEVKDLFFNVPARRKFLRSLATESAHLTAVAEAAPLTLCVNGRPGRDRPPLRAVAQAYGSVLEAGRYPLGVVYLDIDPALVDVNVHPQKAEVRFADGRAVGEALFRILADELARAFDMPVATRSWNRPQPKAPSPSEFPPVHLGAVAEPVVASGLPWSFST